MVFTSFVIVYQKLTNVCREISIVVAVLVLSCLRKLLLLCLLNDVVVTLLCRLPPPTPSHLNPSPFLPPPLTFLSFHFRITGNTGSEYLYNNCFFRIFVHKRKNEKTEVKLLFFVSCTKRKKPKNGSRITFFVFCTRSKKGKKRK